MRLGKARPRLSHSETSEIDTGRVGVSDRVGSHLTGEWCRGQACVPGPSDDSPRSLSRVDGRQRATTPATDSRPRPLTLLPHNLYSPLSSVFLPYRSIPSPSLPSYPSISPLSGCCVLFLIFFFVALLLGQNVRLHT